MSADSRSRFASTLVRRGPVGKRSGGSQDDGSSGSGSVSGSKRSVKDRLGTRRDDSLEGRSRRRHKRQKGEQNHESCHKNSSNDTRLTKGDLRFKLIEQKDPPTDVDLRDKLSSKATLPPADRKRSRPPEATITTRKSMLETRDIYDDERQSVEDRAFDGERRSRRESRGSVVGQSMREHSSSVGGQSMQELGDSYRRQNMRDIGDSDRRQNMRELGDTADRQSMRELGDAVVRQSLREFGDPPVDRQNMRELGDTVDRQSMEEVRDVVGRQSMREIRDGVGRHSMGEPTDSYNVDGHSRQESVDIYSAERRSMQEPWDTYNGGTPSMLGIGDRYDLGRQGLPGQIPSRIGCDLPAVSHARTSYPSWAVDNVRRRSPDMMSCSSMTRTFSPERSLEELQRRTLVRTYDDGSSSLYRRNEVPSPHTATGSAIYMHPPPLNSLPPIYAAPVQLTAQYPHSSGPGPRILNPVEQPSVLGFLQSLGLEKYAINFEHEEVDFLTLRQMTDIDLKELHIPMGPRKKILQSFFPPPRP